MSTTTNGDVGTPHAPNQSLPETPAIPMLRTLGLAATISGLLIVLAFKWTLPYIEENQRRATAAAVFEVLPQAVRQLSFVITATGIQPLTSGVTGDTVYATYDQAGNLLGVALSGAGQGYGDLIQILYAYRPTCKCITGVKVLKMSETPGIGDKVKFDPAFLENFEALDVSLDAASTSLANPIVAVKNGTKNQPWQIDAISGATISCRGMARGLNSSAARLLPLVHKYLPTLQQAGLQ